MHRKATRVATRFGNGRGGPPTIVRKSEKIGRCPLLSSRTKIFAAKSRRLHTYVYVHVDLPFYVSPFFDTISCWPVGGRRQAAAATFTLPCFILGLHVYVSCGQDQRGAERRSPLGSVLVRSKHIASTRHKAVFSILDVFMSRDPYLFDCFGLSNSSFICD